MSLFEKPEHLPLAHRLRPKALSEWVGHEKTFSGSLSKWLERKNIPSLLLWGPPGVGKTTLALLIAEELGDSFIQLSAVSAGVKDIKEAAEMAEKYKNVGRKTLLFLDEIHRLNKSQQDCLLPFVERGLFTLVGATTENPSFEVNSALLSRMRVIRLERLTQKDLEKILDRALESTDGLSGSLKMTDEFKLKMIEQSEGDARRLLTLLDAIAMSGATTPEQLDEALDSVGVKALPYDKNSEEHYNTISAFIKSMRASDPDAAVYYLARMLESGEDPMFIVRRMIIFASEDVGNADPRALPLAISAKQALECVGLPEARINLAHVAISLALAKKDRAMYDAIESALAEVRETGALPVPKVLRNPVTSLMKQQGYGKSVGPAHSENPRLPEGLKQSQFFKK